MLKNKKLKEAHDRFLKLHNLPEKTCFAPYINLDLDQGGGILPCFRSKEWSGNWKQNGPISDYNNETFQQLRDDLHNNKFPPNCVVCANREEKNMHSIRYEFFAMLMDNNSKEEVLDIVDHIKTDHKKFKTEHITSLEIRPHNHCNLECMHCNGFSSTKWQATTKKNYDLLSEDKNFSELFVEYHEGEDVNIDKWISVNNPDSLKDFFNQAKNIKDVHFTGGEPIMDKTHEKWLNLIENKSEINLGYHSNLQHKLYNKLFDIWKQFKHIEIYNSWDACERLYPYFRYHGNFTALTNNLQAIKDSFKNKKILKLRGTLTVNFFSLFDFKDHIDMWTKFDMEPHHSYVEHTHPISLCWLPVELRDKLFEEATYHANEIENQDTKQIVLDMIDEIRDFANQKNDHYDYIPERTKKFILTMDKIRNTNIIEVCPELTKYFQGE